MKKRLVAVFLAAALVMTNSGFVYAAETENAAAEETQEAEETDLAETDREPEEEQQNPVAQEKNEEEPVQSTPAEQPAQLEEHEESVQVQSVQGDFEYTVSDGAVTITKYTGAGGDVTVPETIDGMAVTVIGESAFREVDSVKRVVIPEGVTKIEAGAFGNCIQLAEVNLPSTLTEIGAHAFYNCDLITNIYIPKKLQKTNNAYIYEYAYGYVYGPFYGCDGLKNVTFEEGTTIIANGLFSNCPGLEEIVIPDTVTEIGSEAFYNDTNLREVEFGENINVIRSSAFGKCGQLTKVEMKDQVEKMEAGIFAKCTELTSVRLSKSLKEIGAHSFFDCDKLTSVEIPKSLEKTTNAYIYEYAYGYVYGPFYGCDGLKNVTFEEGTTIIANGLFSNCPGLEEIVIPDTVTEIGSEAFYNDTNLREVEFGENINVIRSSAFGKCGQLTKVEMKDQVEKMEAGIFAKCTELTSVRLSKSLKEIGAHSFFDCDKLTSVEIPKSLEKTTDAYIYEYAYGYVYGPFYGCDGLKNIIFEEGTTSIANGLFENCPGIEELVIPDTVTAIKANAFKNCAGLVKADLSVPSLTIEKEAFRLDASLSEVKMPEQLDYLGAAAFCRCTALTSIEIPTGLEKAADEYDYTGAFAESGIREVIFAEGVTEIASRLFKDVSTIKEIVIPEGVTHIGAYAFENMQSLDTIHIPKSVTEIDRDILYRSENATIYCNANSDILEYALDNGYMFSVIDWDSYEPNVLNKQESFYTANSEAQSGFMDMIVHYALKEEAADKIEDKEISVFLPSNLQLIEGTVRIGQTALDTYSYRDNRLTIPVEEKEGTIRFSINPVESGSLSTAAWMSYTEDGKEDKDIIAVYTLDKDYLTLISNDLTSDSQVEFEGVAPAGSTVTVFVDQEQKMQVTAAESGYYSGQAELTDPQDGKTYTLTASVQNGSETLSKSVSVKYDLRNPVIEEFKLYYSDHDRSYVYDLMNKETLTKTIVFYPQAGYSFQVKMSHPERIDKLYVKSTRGGMTRQIEAEYDEASGYFVTSDKFEEGNNNYVPGMLSVDYELDYEKIYDSPENRAEEILSEYTNSNMVTGDEIQDVEVTDSSVKCTLNVTDDIKLDYQYREYTESEFLEFLKEEGLIEQDQLSDSRTTKDIPDITGLLEELLKSFVVNGVETYTGSIDGDYYTVQYDDTEKVFKTWVLKIPFQYAAQEEIEDICFSVWGNASSEVLEEAQGAVFGFAWDSGSALIEYMGTMWELDMQIRPGMTEYEKAQIEAARSTAFCMLAMRVINAALPMVVGAAGGIPGMIVVGIAQYIIGDWIDTNGNVAEMKAISRFTAILLSKSFSWIIDPSGYVYEAVLDNRLSGVTVTAYWKTDENAEAVLWNASGYQQQNPLLTDSSGAYAWDVPEGLWQVKYEKEGYETAYSDWLPVPPPQTEVNIGLVSKEKPVIENVSVYADHADVVFSKYMIPDTVSSLKLFGADGREVPYTLEYDKESVNAEGVNYAKEYCLNFSGSSILTPESSCRLTVDGTVKSYADVAMDPAEMTASVHKNVEIIAPDHVTVKMGETVDIPVKVANVEEGVSFAAVSGFEAIASVAEASDNGIKVAGHMYGEADVTITIPGTDVKKTVQITVGKETGATDIQPAVVLPQSAYMMSQGESLTIEPAVYPDDTLTGSWSIINGEDVVKMDGDTVTALKEGEAVLRYTLAEEEVYAECRIIVDSDSGDPETPPEPDTPEFTDVHENDWYYDSVQYVSKNKLMTGLNETTFGPLDSLARAQFAVILHRMNGEPDVPYSARFHDVGAGLWYTNAILWAADTQVVTGYSNGNFGPGDLINREQMALMMYRYANYKGYDTSARADFSSYQDASMVSDFAAEAMQWAVGEKIITGKYNETQLDPKGNASRAECATIIMRFVEKYGK